MVNNNLVLSIENLRSDIIKMMDCCSKVVDMAVTSAVTKDVELARQVIKLDDEIDEIRVEVVEKSIELTALKQPMAKDLRLLYALGHMVLDLERIGDYATNIAMETIKIGNEDHVEEMIDIPKMKDVCLAMLAQVREALEKKDYKKAYSAAAEDDILDDLYSDVYVDILAAMHKSSDNINQGVKILFIARHLERIGDHITNICESIIYAVKGEMVEIG